MDMIYLLFIVLGFLAVVLFLEGAYLAWNSYRGPEAQRIERRLRAMSAGGGVTATSLLKKRMLSEVPSVDRALLMIPRVHLLDRLLEQSGTTFTVATFLGVSLLAGLVALVFGLVLDLSLVVTLVLFGVAAALPTIHVLGKRQERMNKIEEQLPDGLDLICRGLRAGHSFPSALQMLGNEGAEPLATEFRTTFDEINFGISVQDALTNLAIRVPSTDVRYFVIAVLIQRETGGNLTELLGNISKLVRDRLRIRGTIRVLSAEGRISAWILTLLPFALTLILNVVNRNFLAVLWTDPVGIQMVIGALLVMLVGIFWMWRIVKIRV